MKNRADVLLISTDKLKNNSYIDFNVAERQIRVAIKFVQDISVRSTLGERLYTELVSKVNDGSINGCWKTLLEDYIHPVFYYGVYSELVIPLSFKNRNVGNYQVGDDKVNPSYLGDIKYLTSYYNNKRDFYINRLRDYVSGEDCFSNYNGNCRPSKSGFNVPINIKI